MAAQMHTNFRIGVLVERQRAYGRRLCEGAASFACEHQEMSLGMLEWRDLDSARSRYNDAGVCRAAHHDNFTPANRNASFGVRVLCTAGLR